MSYVEDAIKYEFDNKPILKWSKGELIDTLEQLRKENSNNLDHLNEVMDKHKKLADDYLEIKLERDKYKEQLDKLFKLI